MQFFHQSLKKIIGTISNGIESLDQVLIYTITLILEVKIKQKNYHKY